VLSYTGWLVTTAWHALALHRAQRVERDASPAPARPLAAGASRT
jgi:hypothetical protein